METAGRPLTTICVLRDQPDLHVMGLVHCEWLGEGAKDPKDLSTNWRMPISRSVH